VSARKQSKAAPKAQRRASAPVIHERALCESDDVGGGTRVWAFAHVMRGAHVGRDCNVGDHAFIETGAWVGDRVTIKNAVLIWDGVRIEDDVFVGPNVVFTNDPNPRAAFKKPASGFLPTHVERGATLGANSSIVCGITIGANAFVGAGAVVIRSVPAHAMVVGNPARRVAWICACGGKLDARLRCGCGRTHRRQRGAGLVEMAD
jgi:UDP-2-acetamido-3-amino-2,3-dideoxy-glucuronate N-acetyltransferase